MTSNPVRAEVAALVEASVAESARRGYRSDLAHFAAWGGPIPAEPALVASYLAAHTETLMLGTPRRYVRDSALLTDNTAGKPL